MGNGELAQCCSATSSYLQLLLEWIHCLSKYHSHLGIVVIHGVSFLTIIFSGGNLSLFEVHLLGFHWFNGTLRVMPFLKAGPIASPWTHLCCHPWNSGCPSLYSVGLPTSVHWEDSLTTCWPFLARPHGEPSSSCVRTEVWVWDLLDSPNIGLGFSGRLGLRGACLVPSCLSLPCPPIFLLDVDC